MVRIAGDPPQRRLQPGVELGHHRRRAGLASGEACLRQLAVDLRLDGEQRLHTLDGLARQGAAVGQQLVVEGSAARARDGTERQRLDGGSRRGAAFGAGGEAAGALGLPATWHRPAMLLGPLFP